MSDKRKIRISRFDRTVQILQVLYWRFGGQINHDTNASGILRAELVKVFGEEIYGDTVAASFSGALKQMEEWGFLHRRVNGRRTTLLTCNASMHQWSDNIKASVQEGELLLPLYERETAERVVLRMAEEERVRKQLFDEEVAARVTANIQTNIEATATWDATVGEKRREEAAEVDQILLSAQPTESYVRMRSDGIGTFPSEHDVARALLDQCFEILQRPDQLKDRLGEQTTVAIRLQKQVDGLKGELTDADQRNRDLQARLQAATRRCDELQKSVNKLAAERIVLDPSQREQWVKLMKELPLVKGGQ